MRALIIPSRQTCKPLRHTLTNKSNRCVNWVASQLGPVCAGAYHHSDFLHLNLVRACFTWTSRVLTAALNWPLFSGQSFLFREFLAAVASAASFLSKSCTTFLFFATCDLRLSTLMSKFFFFLFACCGNRTNSL